MNKKYFWAVALFGLMNSLNALEQDAQKMLDAARSRKAAQERADGEAELLRLGGILEVFTQELKRRNCSDEEKEKALAEFEKKLPQIEGLFDDYADRYEKGENVGSHKEEAQKLYQVIFDK